jgi:hypothetical protein
VTYVVASDDISLNLLLARSASVAALLRRFSHSPYPLLRLLSQFLISIPVTDYHVLYLVFDSAVRKLLTRQDCVRGNQAGSQGAQAGSIGEQEMT